MSNKFLSESTTSLNTGSSEILGSTIGAVNLLSGTTVKVNSQHQLTSSKILITDVQGLPSAISGKLANPSTVAIVAPSFVRSGGTNLQYLMADGSVTTSGSVGPTGATGSQGIQGVTGPTGDRGSDGLSSSVFTYTFSDQTTGTPPTGHLFLDNPTPLSATSVVVNHLDKPNKDIDVLLENVQIGSTLIVQRSNDSNTYIRYQVASRTLSVGYVTYGVTYLAQAGTITNNNEVLLITQAQGIQGIQGATGPTGSNGTSVDLEYAFFQAGYYGTVPTFNLINMASGSVTNIGGSVSIGANTGINQLTKTYHVRSLPSSTVNGASSGWVGSSTFQPFFVGQGFKITYSFGLLDTSTNASTRTIIGIGNFNTAVVLNSTTAVSSLTNQFLGIIQETGETVFSFYTRGTGTTTPTASSVTCQTPNTGWYTVTFHNDVNSSNVTITLKYVQGGSVTTSTQTYLCGGANTLSTSQACYPILQRSMSSAGGTSGSSILAMNSLKFYTR